jgi:anti-anti-sigma factor
MSNNIQIRKVGSHSDIALIKIRGFLDTMLAYQLQEKAEEQIETGIYKYIINFESLEYISSAGIEAFHDIAQKLQENNGEIIFTNVPDKIYKLFEAIGTITFFRIKDTIREAMREFEPDEL